MAATLGSVGLMALPGCARDASPVRRPNVLLVVIDTLRADHLGTYGFRFATSPSLDALAAQSVVFERAIAAAPSTVPSHIAILTSRYVREIGVSAAAVDRLRDRLLE